MNKIVMAAVALSAVVAFAQDKVAVKFVLPAPHSSGTPKEIS